MKKIIFILCIFILSACSIEPNTPAQAVSNVFDAIETNNVELFNEYSTSYIYDYILDDINFIPSDPALSSSEVAFYTYLIPYMKTFEYEITNETIEPNNQALVTVTITRYDITQAITDLNQSVIDRLKYESATSMDSYYTFMISALEESLPNYFNETMTLEIPCVQHNQKWRVDIDDTSAFIYYLFAE